MKTCLLQLCLKSRITALWCAEKQLPSTEFGFTLLELLVVVVMLSTLFAIAAPGWAAFVNGQRLNVAQDQAYQAIRDAQSSAKQHHIAWQASFQNANGIVQWATHPVGSTPTASLWHSLDSTIQLDSETTLPESGGIYRIQFDHSGQIKGQLGRLTLSDKVNGKAKRCVIASTLLGVIRVGQDHPKPQNEKYCY